MKDRFPICRVRTQVIIFFQSTCQWYCCRTCSWYRWKSSRKIEFTCQMCEDLRHLNSSNSYSLNFVDCFPGACIIAPFAAEWLCLEGLENNRPVSMRASLFKKRNSSNPGIKLNMKIELNMNKCKSGIDLSGPDPYTLAFEPWRLTQHMVTHWEPPELEPCHRSTPLTG